MSYEMPESVPRYNAEEIETISKTLHPWDVLARVFPGFTVDHPAYDALCQAARGHDSDLRGRIDALFHLGGFELSAAIWCDAMDILGYTEVYRG